LIREIVTAVSVASVLTVGLGSPALAQKANPCAPKNPCAVKSANPCAQEPVRGEDEVTERGTGAGPGLARDRSAPEPTVRTTA